MSGQFESFKPEAILKPTDEISNFIFAQAAFKNFFIFCLTVLGINFTWFHKKWFHFYQNNEAVYVISSRRMGKSTWTQALAVWEAMKSRKRILVVMNAGGQTGEWMRYCLSMLQDAVDRLSVGMNISIEMQTEEVTNQFGQKITQESIGRIMLSNGSVIYGRSLGGKIRGVNADIIICDDLLDKKMNMSFAEAEHIFRAVIMGVMEDKTKIIYVGTIIMEGDALDKLHTGEIEGFVGDKFPAVLDWDTEEVLWPEVRPMSWIKKQRQRVGEMDFQVEYMLDPLSDKLALIPLSMSDKAKNDELVLGRTPHPDSTVVIGVDLQISPSQDADWSVFFALEVFDDEWRILDMERLQADENVQLRILDDMARKYQAYEVLVETNGFQRIFANLFRQMSDKFSLNIAEFNTTRGEKHDTQVGIPSLRTLFTNDVITIPWGEDTDTKVKMDIFMRELAGWQYDKEKKKFVSKRRHDDTTMAFWFAVLSARKMLDPIYDVIDRF